MLPMTVMASFSSRYSHSLDMVPVASSYESTLLHLLLYPRRDIILSSTGLRNSFAHIFTVNTGNVNPTLLMDRSESSIILRPDADFIPRLDIFT